MVLIEARRIPRPLEVGMPRHRDAGELPWHSLIPSQHRLQRPRLGLLARKGGRQQQEADEADRANLVGSSQYWKGGRHGTGTNPSTRGQRAATGPWPEGGQRWGERPYQGRRRE